MEHKNNIIKLLTFVSENIYENTIFIDENKWKAIQQDLQCYNIVEHTSYRSDCELSPDRREIEITNRTACDKVISFSVKKTSNYLPITLVSDLYDYDVEAKVEKYTDIFRFMKEPISSTTFSHIYQWYYSNMDSSIFNRSQKKEILYQIQEAIYFNKEEVLGNDELQKCLAISDVEFVQTVNKFLQRTQENTKLFALLCQNNNYKQIIKK